MPGLDFLYEFIGIILPFDCMKMHFMQRALMGLLILAPTAAIMGVQVVNFRMAFFTDTISHSAFTGIALGLIMGINPYLTAPIFAVFVGVSIISFLQKSHLAEDSIIGVFFSGVVAFGLTVVSREKNISRNLQTFLYGDILTISDSEIFALMILSSLIILFLFFSYNKLLYLGLSNTLATAHRVKVKFYQYSYSILLSLIIIFSVWAVGVLLVTAMLIVPAAAGRNLARSAGGMLWWAMIIALLSSLAGFLISVQDWARTATGATVVIIAFLFFVMSQVIRLLKK